jgi:tetratricopeptide (TPR) repeat protein
MFLKKRDFFRKYQKWVGLCLIVLIIILLGYGFFFITSGGIKDIELQRMQMKLQTLDKTNIASYRESLYNLLASCNDLLKIDAANPGLYLLKARVCNRLYRYEKEPNKRVGLVDKIILNYRKVMALNENGMTGSDYAVLSRMYNHKGSHYQFQVVKYAQKAMKQEQYNLRLRKLYTFGLINTGEYEKGYAELRKLRKHEDDEIRFYRAIALKHLGRYDEAKEVFERIIQKSSEISLIQKSYNNIAWMAYSKGLYSRAVQLYMAALDFAKAYKIDKDISEIYFWLSKVYFKQRNWYMGRHYRKLAQKIDPSNRFLQQKRRALQLRKKKKRQRKGL